MSTGQGLVWGWDIPQLAKKSRAYVLCSIFKGAIVKLLRLVLAARLSRAKTVPNIMSLLILSWTCIHTSPSTCDGVNCPSSIGVK
ncbi:hypothetical protein ACKLNR_000537 [Fusarium oxysporum f. sp. zingiberi]